MFQILIDTCVWLDLAKDPHQQTLLATLESLVELKKVELILPRTILDEFARNKGRIVEDSTRSISSTLKRAKEIVDKFGEGRRKRIAMSELQNVDHLIPTLGDAAVESVSRIEALFQTASIVEISDAIKLHAVQRAIDKRAPFHRQRNGIGDAILIECYGEMVRDNEVKGRRLAFITHNKLDFSHTGTDERLPHPDIAGFFSKIRSLYSISLVETLRRVDPDLLDELTFESEWTEEPRRASEIIVEINQLVDKVWFNRHQNRCYEIEQGETKIVSEDEWTLQNSQRAINRKIWDGALKSAAKMKKKYGAKNLGPWSDFEWGMLNGKLSALRWVLGEEWDSLDT